MFKHVTYISMRWVYDVDMPLKIHGISLKYPLQNPDMMKFNLDDDLIGFVFLGWFILRRTVIHGPE